MNIGLEYTQKVISAPFIRRETDFAFEAYCIECGYGGYVKGKDGERFYFYEDQGPFCNTSCFANFLGVEQDILPPVKPMGSLKVPSNG